MKRGVKLYDMGMTMFLAFSLMLIMQAFDGQAKIKHLCKAQPADPICAKQTGLAAR